MGLKEYLGLGAATRWKAGTHDCSAWPAKWAGIPLPDYTSDAEGEALVAEHGGLLPLWEHCIGDRLERIEQPNEGAVGIIRALGRDMRATEVGAIWNGRRWAFLTPNGLAAASADAIAIWRVHWPRP